MTGPFSMTHLDKTSSILGRTTLTIGVAILLIAFPPALDPVRQDQYSPRLAGLDLGPGQGYQMLRQQA